jgi:hypothetical protein
MKMIITCFIVSVINIYLYHYFVVSKYYTPKKDYFKDAFDVQRCMERLDGAAGKTVEGDALPVGEWVRNGDMTWDTMVLVKGGNKD